MRKGSIAVVLVIILSTWPSQINYVISNNRGPIHTYSDQSSKALPRLPTRWFLDKEFLKPMISAGVKELIVDLRFGGSLMYPDTPCYVGIDVPSGNLAPIRCRAPPPMNITLIKLPYDSWVINVSVLDIETRLINLPMRFKNLDLSAEQGGIIDVHDRDLLGYIRYDIRSGIDPLTLKPHKFLIMRTQTYVALNDNVAKRIVSMRIKVTYLRSPKLGIKEVTYDVLIITSKKLQQAAERLQGIKEREGFRIKIMYVEDIYDNIAFEGRDRQESIRKYIKYAWRNFGIKFVIILGDTDVVPVRYAYIPDGAFDNNPNIDGDIVETDLYYADLDNTWDDNNDGHWGDLEHDNVDGWPDVLVGRISVSNLTEAMMYIDKISRYRPIDSLQSRVLFVGTDTFMVGYPEGEYLLEYSSKFVRNATITRIYETFGNLTRTTFIQEMDEGYSLVAFTGHGTHDSLVVTFSETYSIGDALSQRNKIYPIFVALSCDAGRFAEVDGIGEALILNPNGGAIAFLGSSRLAWGYIGELVTSGLMGEMVWRTIRAYFDHTSKINTTLGAIWARAISEYITKHGIRNTLAGYYLDWKTVAEYNLLGDPTLFTRKPIRAEFYDSLNIENETYLIENKTIVFGGNIYMNNGSLLVKNSIVLVNNITAWASNITIENSIVIGICMCTNNSRVDIRNSSVAIIVDLINSTLNITDGIINNVMVYDNSSDINAYNSTLQLMLINITEEVNNWHSGFIDYYNLSTMGILGEINTSYAGLSIMCVGAALNITNSSIDIVVANKTEIYIVSSKVASLTIYNSTIESIDSTMGIMMYVMDSSENIELEPSNYTSYLLIISNSTIDLVNTEVIYWSLHIRSAEIRIVASKIANIETYSSNIQAVNTSIVRVEGSNTELYMNSSTSTMIYGAIDLAMDESNITLARIADCEIKINKSRVFVVHGVNVDIVVNESYIYQIYLEEGSQADICASEVVEFVVRDRSSVKINDSRMVLLDCKQECYAELYNTDVIYWLRIYDHVEVIVKGGEVWFGLTYNNTEANISGIYPGSIDVLTINNTNGWRLVINDVIVVGWDIILFNSKLRIHDCELGWIFSYYNSTIDINEASVMLLRATHNSTVEINGSLISSIYMSGRAILDIHDSLLDSLYVLGYARAFVSKSSFAFLAGMGTDAHISINNSYGGYIAAIQNVSISVRESVATIYMAFVGKNIHLKNYRPNYIESWESQDTLGVSLDWSVRIDDSWVSWAFDFDMCDVVLEDSMLVDLYVSNSKAIINGIKTSSFFVAFGSNVTIKDSDMYGISFVWKSNVSVDSSTLPILYIYDSKIDATGSLLGPVLYIMSGSLYVRELLPGHYDSFSLDDYVMGDINTRINATNSSLYAWSIMGVGINGDVDICVENSALLSIGIAYNASLTMRRTYIYGYTLVYMDSGSVTSVNIFDSITMLYVYVMNIDNLELDGIDSIEWNFTGYIIPNVYLHNVTIMGLDIDAYGSVIKIYGSKIGTMFVRASNITIYNSSLDNIQAIDSTVEIENSNSTGLSAYGCSVKVQKSEIGNMLLYASEFTVEDSAIGVNVYVAFTRMSISSLSPMHVDSAASPDEIPIMANGTFNDVDIKAWYLTVSEFATVSISNSSIGSVSVIGFNTHVQADNVNVSSIDIGKGTIILEDATVGLNVNISNVMIKVFDLREGYYEYLDSDMITSNNVYWDLILRETNITNINITVSGSVVQFQNCSSDIMIADSSEIYARESDVIQFLSIAAVDIVLNSSWMRLASLSTGSKLYSSNSTIGVVMGYIYGNVFPKINTESTTRIFNDQLFAEYIIKDSEVYDWTIYAGFIANVTVINSTIFTGYSDGKAKLWLIDTSIEYPLDAYDLGEIHVLFTLEVNIRYDFRTPKTADLTIEGKELIIKSTVKDGYYRTLLYQGIVRSYERIDLGKYKVRVKVGMFGASKEVYLWKTTKTTIYIIGPITIGLMIATAATIIYLAYKYTPLKRVHIKEKISGLFKRVKTREGEHSGSLSK